MSRATWHLADNAPIVWRIAHIEAEPYSYAVLPAIDTSDIPEAGEEWFKRARLFIPGYFDSRWPERPCDRCGRRYRGRAVYCSLKCALEDA